MKSEKDTNLYSMLCNIQYPRRPQGKMHKVEFILLISIMAIMNGSTSIYAICDFAQINKKELIFLYSCHPTQSIKFGYGWIKRVRKNILKQHH